MGLTVAMHALIIMGLLWLFARHEADFEYSTVFLVVVGIILGGFLIVMSLTKYLGIFVVIPIFLYVCFLLVKFCWVPWPKGLLITFLFFVVSAAIQIGKIYIMSGGFHLSDVPGFGADSEPITASSFESLGKFEKPTNSVAAPNATSATTANPAVPPTPQLPAGTESAIKPDWDIAKSLIRVRGSMRDAKGQTNVMVNDEIIPVGGTFSVDSAGLRYTWRLTAINGSSATWQPVGVAPVPPPRKTP